MTSTPKAKAKVVVPWHRKEERDAFVEAWGLNVVPAFLHFQQDADRAGCGATKNRGVIAAAAAGAEIVVVLDGDCYPAEEAPTLEELLEHHVLALEPQPVEMYQPVTYPSSRGVPYFDLTLTMPVAASMGFWLNVPDYCAVRQLAFAEEGDVMRFTRDTVFQRYFPLCGMNVAFKPDAWWPWWQFIDVSRFDDIWMGWLWQREAYRRGFCFNLNGPLITHSRQSNVWKNLIDEARYLEQTENLWKEIAQNSAGDYATLLRLLPTGIHSLSDSPTRPWVK
jgi:hypothetical protein